MSSTRFLFRLSLVTLVLCGYIGLALVVWGLQWILAPNRR